MRRRSAQDILLLANAQRASLSVNRSREDHTDFDKERLITIQVTRVNLHSTSFCPMRFGHKVEMDAEIERARAR